jgi:hypothetical protein
MVARLDVPIELRHRNEVDAETLAAAERAGLPVVLGRDASGTWHPVLTRDGLKEADGDVAAFERLLRAALAAAPRP